jgi:hypothetical protein
MKQGGNAYKLFEVLRERDAQTAPKAQDQPPAETRKYTPVDPHTAVPRPTLLLGGIEEKPAQTKPAAPATQPAQRTATQAPQAKPAKETAQAPKSVLGHYRGKALVVKYDVAMVVTLFMMGLLVIAFVWGYSAGKSVGVKEERARFGSVAGLQPGEPAGPTGKTVTPPPSSKLLDDGDGDYCLRLVSGNRDGIENFAKDLRDKGYPNVVVQQSGSSWVLYLGRFRTSESADKYREYFLKDENGYGGSYSVRRPNS